MPRALDYDVVRVSSFAGWIPRIEGQRWGFVVRILYLGRRSLIRLFAAATLGLAVSFVLVGCGTAVPDTRGMTVEQAIAAIEVAGFKVGKVTYDQKAAGAAGAVIGQEPEAGKRTKKNSLVVLAVAGPPPVVTPDLSGLDKEEAAAALAASGLKLGDVSESYDTSVPAGVVASQTPMARRDAPEGSAVALVISKGLRPVAVPSTKGKTQEDATKLLEAAGFKVKAETKSDTAKKGIVITQSPGGDEAQPGSTVTVVISSGVSHVRAPDFCALAGEADLGDGAAYVFSEPRHYGDPSRLDAYREVAKKAGVEVEFLYSADMEGGGFEHGMNSWPVGQSPAPGARVKEGTTVRLIVWN